MKAYEARADRLDEVEGEPEEFETEKGTYGEAVLKAEIEAEIRQYETYTSQDEPGGDRWRPCQNRL